MEMSRDTFEKADTDTKLLLLFDVATATHQEVANIRKCHVEHMATCTSRFTKLENRKRLDTTLSAITGAITGSAVAFLQWMKG